MAIPLLQNNYLLVIATVSARDSKGNIPLHWATYTNYYTIVKLLLDHKSHVNAKNHRDHSPLFIAARYGHTKIAALLLAHKALINSNSTNSKRTYSSTPLHQAAQHGHHKIIDLLLAHNATIDTQTKQGALPIHYAARGGHIKTIQALLDYERTLLKPPALCNRIAFIATHPTALPRTLVEIIIAYSGLEQDDLIPITFLGKNTLFHDFYKQVCITKTTLFLLPSSTAALISPCTKEKLTPLQYAQKKLAQLQKTLGDHHPNNKNTKINKKEHQHEIERFEQSVTLLENSYDPTHTDFISALTTYIFEELLTKITSCAS